MRIGGLGAMLLNRTWLPKFGPDPESRIDSNIWLRTGF